jgi:hypothetical protein
MQSGFEALSELAKAQHVQALLHSTMQAPANHVRSTEIWHDDLLVLLA